MESFDFTGKVVLEFYEHGCLNCTLMVPVFNDLKRLFPEVRFYQINTAEHPELVRQYQIESVPCLLLFNHGQKQAALVGLKSRTQVFNLMSQIFRA